MQRLDPLEVRMYDNDTPQEFIDLILDKGIVAWDIETSGLLWNYDKIAICQLYIPNGPAAIVRIHKALPKQLQSLLFNSSIKKIFHHAMFDCRFMGYYWKVIPQNIACTKLAAKLLDKENENKNTLQSLLDQHLNIRIDKTLSTSNWFAPMLTEQQKMYAIADVQYLPTLLNVLEDKLRLEGILDLAHACFAHIPTRVQLDIMGYKDIYVYE